MSIHTEWSIPAHLRLAKSYRRGVMVVISATVHISITRRRDVAAAIARGYALALRDAELTLSLRDRWDAEIQASWMDAATAPHGEPWASPVHGESTDRDVSEGASKMSRIATLASNVRANLPADRWEYARGAQMAAAMMDRITLTDEVHRLRRESQSLATVHA